jgi:transporter family-2 protein
LRAHLSSPWWAGLVSYAVGFSAMIAAVLFVPGPALRGGLSDIPWFAWIGGLFGAIFITIAIVMVPRLGAATTIALVVVGQMFASLVFDHFGLLGLVQYPATFTRLAGAGFLILGVFLIRA